MFKKAFEPVETLIQDFCGGLKDVFSKSDLPLCITFLLLGILGGIAFAISVVNQDEYIEPSETVTEQITIAETTTLPIETTTAPEVTAIKVTATAYCGCSYCTDGDGITATGTKATQGRTIAVDPSVIPYGTKVIINGNTYIAEDCGGAIKGKMIDIYFDSHEEAKQFGRQKLTVYVPA